MEFGQSGDVMKKRISFGLSVADEKIKLIDILSEDDYFLVASPFSDHDSLKPSISEFERMEESRPSFLRRSLAWDSAFFNNSGVLDPDELFFINNGANETSLLPATHEVRNRRSESESTPNDVGFSADWFELQPSIIESKSSKALNVAQWNPKSGLKQNHQSSKKVDGLSRNKVARIMKSDQTCIGKSIDVQSRSKLKTESSTRRASSNMNLSIISNLNPGKKSIRTSLGQSLVMDEKFTHKSSSNSLSSPKFSLIYSPAAAAASNLSKRTTELKKTHNSVSSPNSNISRLSVRKKGMGNITTSTHSTSFCSSPANSTRLFPSATLLSPVHKQRRSVDSKDVKEASNRQSSLQIPKQNCSLSARSIRPSGLRPPSPHLRFFDESTPQHAERSRKMPQKKIKTPSTAIDEQNGKKELDNLCRNFEAVALESEKISGGAAACSIVKEENKQPSSKMASSTRTPLADRTSKCNFGGAFASPMEPKKEKFLRRASSVRYDCTKRIK